MAGRWMNFSISPADGPVPMKLRPSRPSVPHDTSEPSPPERRLVAGWCTPAGVAVLRTENAASATLTASSVRAD